MLRLIASVVSLLIAVWIIPGIFALSISEDWRVRLAIMALGVVGILLYASFRILTAPTEKR